MRLWNSSGSSQECAAPLHFDTLHAPLDFPDQNWSLRQTERDNNKDDMQYSFNDATGMRSLLKLSFGIEMHDIPGRPILRQLQHHSDILKGEFTLV